MVEDALGMKFCKCVSRLANSNAMIDVMNGWVWDGLLSVSID